MPLSAQELAKIRRNSHLETQLHEAKRRLGRGKVGELRGHGVCLFTENTFLGVTWHTPLIGIKDGRLAPLLQDSEIIQLTADLSLPLGAVIRPQNGPEGVWDLSYLPKPRRTAA